VAAARVLVVDDDPDVSDYFATFLGDHGYLVESSANAFDALLAIESFRPDVVLIDVMMPGRSGLDLLVTLRRDSRWCELPLVVMTGDDQVLQDEFQTYLRSHGGVRGPEGVLAKPIDRRALLTLLSSVRDPDVRTTPTT
jgi:CheY-like chemotaxis protein